MGLEVSSGTQIYLASDCNSTGTESYFWDYSPGSSSPVVTLQKNNGRPGGCRCGNLYSPVMAIKQAWTLRSSPRECITRPFPACGTLNSPEVCIDTDGAAPLHRPGPTGEYLFVSPVA